MLVFCPVVSRLILPPVRFLVLSRFADFGVWVVHRKHFSSCPAVRRSMRPSLALTASFNRSRIRFFTAKESTRDCLRRHFYSSFPPRQIDPCIKTIPGRNPGSPAHRTRARATSSVGKGLVATLGRPSQRRAQSPCASWGHTSREPECPASRKSFCPARQDVRGPRVSCRRRSRRRSYLLDPKWLARLVLDPRCE